MLKTIAQAGGSGRQASLRREGSRAGATRAQIVAAVIRSLQVEGFAGTSARAIARHGGFNQALIFYHFGSVPDLMVAALQQISDDRLRVYRDALAPVSTIPDAIQVARSQYELDVAGGHIAVLAELIAGASSLPELGPHVVRCMEPWITFATETFARLLRGTLLERLVPAEDAATALVSLYVGMELVDHLDPGAKISERLFSTAERLVRVAAPLLGGARSRGTAARSRKPRRIPIR